MNKTKIEYCDYTWNPVVGCKNGCYYCYARKIRARFNPDIPFTQITTYDERLEQPFKIKKPSVIFVGSMTDLFAEWAPRYYVKYILDVAAQCHWHTFLFLTKKPAGYHHYNFPDNCWLGTTIASFDDRWRGAELATVKHPQTFISLEPLLDDTVSDYCFLSKWLIVGSLTGMKGFTPSKSTIEELTRRARRTATPLFLKDSIYKLYPDMKSNRQLPFELGGEG